MSFFLVYVGPYLAAYVVYRLAALRKGFVLGAVVAQTVLMLATVGLYEYGRLRGDTEYWILRVLVVLYVCVAYGWWLLALVVGMLFRLVAERRSA